MEVARNPDRDWTVPTPPMVMDSAGVKESSEPNDVASQAAPLTVGSIDGGICDGMPDSFGWMSRVHGE